MLVIVNVILVGVTSYYAWQTRKTVKIMEEALRAEFRPHLNASLERVGPTAVELSLKNLGKGPAIDCNVQISMEPSGELRRWYNPLLAPGDSETFQLEPYQLNELAEKYDSITICGKYKDIFGESYEVDEKIDLKEIRKTWYESRIILREPLERKMDEIIRELKGIQAEIKKIATKIEDSRRPPA
jgi:hypothetical protein